MSNSPSSSNRENAHDCREHFVSMNTRNADDRDPPLWCPVCGSVKHSGSIVHLRPAINADVLRWKWETLKLHVVTIAKAGARNEERQRFFEEIRSVIERLDGAK